MLGIFEIHGSIGLAVPNKLTEVDVYDLHRGNQFMQFLYTVHHVLNCCLLRMVAGRQSGLLTAPKLLQTCAFRGHRSFRRTHLRS